VFSYAVDEPLTISIDNEIDLGVNNARQDVIPDVGGLTVINEDGDPVLVVNEDDDPVNTGGPGLDVFGPYPMANNGRMIGLTVQTNASDVALLSLNLGEQVYSPNVF